MKWILLIPVFSMAVYLIPLFKKHGIQPTVSATAKLLGSKDIWKATIALWGVAIPIMIVAAKPLFFLSGVLIILVATAVQYWEKNELVPHLVGAIGGIAVALVSIPIYFLNWKTVLVLGAFVVFELLTYTKTWKLENRTLWEELAALGTVLLALFLSI